MPDDVLEMIGTAALLEQLAEESAELAQAALKMARKIRLAKAMDLLMQAGALAMNERDALREYASRTAAERLFNSLLR